MEYMSRKQVAAELNISIRSVARLLSSGALPKTKVGNVSRISRAALEKYLASQTTAGNDNNSGKEA